MNSEIVAIVSKTSLSFHYSQNGGAFKVFEFNGHVIIPLYFYSDGKSFEIGGAAKLRYNSKNENAFYDYFKLIKDTSSTFLFLDGSERKYKDLLLCGIEYLVNAFLDEIMMSSDRINSVREELSLNLVFASDIKENEINFLGDIFKSKGYNNIRLIYYNYLLLNHLDANRKIGAFKGDSGIAGAFKGYIIIDGLDGDLFIDYFNHTSSKTPKWRKVGEDLANNPKDKIIAKMLFDGAKEKSGSLVKEKSELPLLFSLAQTVANSKSLEPRVLVEFSDGSKEKIKIKMKLVEEKLSYVSNFTKDFDAVRELQEKSGVSNAEVGIIICNTITSENFKEKLKSFYNSVYPSYEPIDEVLGLFNNSSAVINNGDFLSVQNQSAKKPEAGHAPVKKLEVKPEPSKLSNSELTKAPPAPVKGYPKPPTAPSAPTKPPAPVSPKPSSSGGNKKPPPPPLPPPPVKSKGNKKTHTENAVLKPLPMPLKTVSKPVTKSQKGKSLPPPPPPPPLPPPPRKKK